VQTTTSEKGVAEKRMQFKSDDVFLSTIVYSNQYRFYNIILRPSIFASPTKIAEFKVKIWQMRKNICCCYFCSFGQQSLQ